MKLTNAERQKQYRDNMLKRGDNGDSRINTFVTSSAGFALGRLSLHYGLTKRQVLELLIINAENSLAKNWDINSTEWGKYFNIKSPKAARIKKKRFTNREKISRFVKRWTSAARQMCYNRKQAYLKEVWVMLTNEYNDFV
ncbi:hypothetical protein PZC96_004913, partial [Salmonella enterica]|nr:hypothetical protein [Salmonella enterica]